MAVQITSDTVVKIILRRGQNADRENIILSNGELGYVQDTQRVFVGDGVTFGGNLVGNVFFGLTPNINSFDNIAENGDTVFDSAYQTLYGFSNGSWYSLHPAFDPGVFDKAANGTIRLSENLFAPGLYYNLTSPIYSLAQQPNVVDFDARYISLCADYTSWFIGNYFNKQVTNNWTATLNVDNSLFINDSNPGGAPRQLQLYAYAPGTGRTTIDAASGIFDIKARDEMRLYSMNIESVRLSATPYGGYAYFLNKGGSYAKPNFQVTVYTRFLSSSYFDENVTIYGNLSVYGDSTYIETTITTTSALSVVNNNSNEVALVVRQANSIAANQTIARFLADTTTHPVLQVKDGPFVGINAISTELYSTNNANFAVSGSMRVGPGIGSTYDANAYVDLQSGDTGRITLRAGSGKINISNAVVYESTPANYSSSNRLMVLDGSNNLGYRDINSTAWNPSGTYHDGNLTTNYIPKATAVRTLGDSVIYETGTNIGIGTTTPGAYKLNVNGSFNSTSINTGAVTAGAIGCTSVTATGAIACNSLAVNTSYTISNAGILSVAEVRSTGDVIAYYSDERLKENIQPLENALDKVCSLRGFTYTPNELAKELGVGKSEKQVGVFAQDIEKVLPEIVKPAPFDLNEEGNSKSGENYKTVQYEKLIPLLIEAIKELNQKIK
jgi:hypothetical protein